MATVVKTLTTGTVLYGVSLTRKVVYMHSFLLWNLHSMYFIHLVIVMFLFSRTWRKRERKRSTSYQREKKGAIKTAIKSGRNSSLG